MKLAKAQCLDLLYRLIRDRCRTEYHCNVQSWYVPIFVLSAHQNLIAGHGNVTVHAQIKLSSWQLIHTSAYSNYKSLSNWNSATNQQAYSISLIFCDLFFACYDDRHKYNKSIWLPYVYFILPNLVSGGKHLLIIFHFRWPIFYGLDQQGLIMRIQSYSVHSNV